MRNYKLLIADDESAIIESITNVLEKFNYEILAAPNGQKAYNIATKVLPDLIITDWEMPVLNGVELIRKLKNNESTKGIPIIMITGVMNTLDNLKIAFDAGATDFIDKPIVPVELVARTRSMLMLADYYKEAIKQKDWELTLQAKNMLTNTEFNSKLLSKLEILTKNHLEDNESAKKILNDIKFELNLKIKTQAWEDFENHFKSVHPLFMENLINNFPKLSSGEIKLCALLRLNLNSKEIASILFQNPQSIDIARYRLRKKMDLNRDDNLNSFLLSI
ncbi:MAG: response regulator [Bacteroidales bacterium]|nr:response regulator [Bacteroidales bacterium]